MPKTISIATTVYKHAQYLPTWFCGIKSQILPEGYELEVNVVVDGDSYDLLCLQNIIKGSDLNIRIWFNHKNQGGPQSLTNALSMCTGEFIAILDGDDYWKPNKLIKSLDFLNKTNFDAVFTEVETILNDGRHVVHSWKNIGIFVPSTLTFEYLLGGNRCYTCSSLFKSECFKDAPTPKDFERKFSFLGDYPRVLWLAKNGFSLGYLDESLSVYRDSVGVNNKIPGESAKYDHLVRQWANNGCLLEDLD